MQGVRGILYQWVSGVMEERGWTAATWARYADVTPTNLSRFLKDPESASLPSAETIGRLAWAAGSQPQFLSGNSSNGTCRIPILTLEQVHVLLHLRRTQRQEFIGRTLRENGRCVVLERQSSARAFALQITSQHMNAAGLLPNDQVVVEPMDLQPARSGDLVIAVDGDKVCGYRYYPPHLIPVSTDSSCAPVLCAGATVAGIAVHIARPIYH